MQHPQAFLTQSFSFLSIVFFPQNGVDITLFDIENSVKEYNI